MGRIASSIIIILLLFSGAFSIVGTNTASASPPPNGIVAIGDSITEGVAAAPNTYPAQLSKLLNISVKNMGIGGQTTTQMLARFYTDVVANNPESVIIEGGINDIANVTVVLAGYDTTTFNVIVEANATSDLDRVALAASGSGTSSSSGCTVLIVIAIVAFTAIGGMFYMGRRPKTPH